MAQKHRSRFEFEESDVIHIIACVLAIIIVVGTYLFSFMPIIESERTHSDEIWDNDAYSYDQKVLEQRKVENKINNARKASR